MIATKCKCNLSTKGCGVDSPLTIQFHHCKCQDATCWIHQNNGNMSNEKYRFWTGSLFHFFILFLLLLLETNIVLSWIKYKEGREILPPSTTTA